MPYMINGIGTTVICGRGEVKELGPLASDAVEWFVVFFFPVIPYRCVHTFHWNGQNYQAFPIRWSGALVARTFLKSLSGFLGLMAVLFTVIGVAMFFGKTAQAGWIAFLGIGLLLGALAFGLWWLLGTIDRRDRDIRVVLGYHQMGASDPAHWPEEMQRQINPPADHLGVESFADAVGPCLTLGDFNQAMWYARACVALEDAAEGEALTDRILRHPLVEVGLQEFRKKQKTWNEVMLPAGYVPPPPVPPPGTAPLPPPLPQQQPEKQSSIQSSRPQGNS